MSKTRKKPTPPVAGQRGRPKGSKNKTTIFKEVMQEGFEKALQKDFKKVLEAVVQKAKDGDMRAAKMLMDRVVPVSKAIDLDALRSGGLAINIAVGKMEDQREDIETTYEEIKDAESEIIGEHSGSEQCKELESSIHPRVGRSD